VFCGDDVEVPADLDLRADVTPRALIGMLTHPDSDSGASLTARQRHFLAHHGQQVAALVADVPTPYVPGTRIEVPGRDGGHVTGTVTQPLRDGGTVTAYRWRPDAADLPGHPWHHLPVTRATITSPASAVTATLLGPDPGLREDTTPLAYGGIVSYLTDDGDTRTGDVVRVLPGNGDVDYDIRFHGEPLDRPPTRLPGRDVVAVRGTAWPDLDTLLAARVADTTDRVFLGELLVAADGSYGFPRLDRDGVTQIWAGVDGPSSSDDVPPWIAPDVDSAADLDPTRDAAMTAPGHPTLEPRLKVCRLLPSGVLLDIPLRPPAGTQLAAGTFWQDPAAAGGWFYDAWDRGPDGRGFHLPGTIDLGDIVGFAAFRRPTAPPADNVWAPPNQQPPPAAPLERVSEWWGYLHAVERDTVVLHGPHPDAVAALTDAQRAFVARLHNPAAAAAPPAVGEPAQNPASTTVSWSGDLAIVGDPTYGWLHVPSTDLTAALTLPADTLTASLRPYLPELTGNEPPITLAALAAHYLPDQLPDPTTPPPPVPIPLDPAPTPPAGPDPTGPNDPAATAGPDFPDPDPTAEPDPAGDVPGPEPMGL